MRKTTPIHIIVYRPESLDGKIELERRTADIHAEVILRQVKALKCPVKQKIKLMQAIADTARQRASDR